MRTSNEAANNAPGHGGGGVYGTSTRGPHIRRQSRAQKQPKGRLNPQNDFFLAPPITTIFNATGSMMFQSNASGRVTTAPRPKAAMGSRRKKTAPLRARSSLDGGYTLRTGESAKHPTIIAALK